MVGSRAGQHWRVREEGAVPQAVLLGAEHPATLPGPGCCWAPTAAPSPRDGLGDGIRHLCTQRYAAGPSWHRCPWTLDGAVAQHFLQ